MNLNWEVKTLYSENFKNLKENVDEDMRWNNLPFIYIERKKTVKTALLPKAIYKLAIMPMKTPGIFFTDIKIS